MRDPYRALLWSAPELLRVKAQPVHGTQKGDVYSFAILAQQIAYRAQPFFIADDQNPRGQRYRELDLSCSVQKFGICYFS